MKNNSKILFFCFILLFFSSCTLSKNEKITVPEYTKEIVQQNSKFNNAIDEVLDQIETYNGSEDAKERLYKLVDNALGIIKYLKDDLGPKVPSDVKSHYDSMMEAYNLYKEGLELYKEYVPATLSDERKAKIKLAEYKFESALQKMKNIKNEEVK